MPLLKKRSFIYILNMDLEVYVSCPFFINLCLDLNKEQCPYLDVEVGKVSLHDLFVIRTGVLHFLFFPAILQIPIRSFQREAAQ